jgi:polyhydroxybutyrate depolymerase
MTRRKLVIGVLSALIGLPALLLLILFANFYAVFYFPNANRAAAGTLLVAGEERGYLLYVPKSYDHTKPTPLVIAMHTAMSWPASLMSVSRWNDLADQEGFIVVYPAGTGYGPKSWEMTSRETPARMPDVVFISALLDTLETSYHIDKTRIYANGMSNGGSMAFVLSCTLSNRIAAVGMVSAGLDPGWSWCEDHRAVPVIAFHGTADPILPYNGGHPKLGDELLPSVPGFMANWARRNHCAPQPTDSAVTADVSRRRYDGCADGAAVVLYTLAGEGHQWPGGRPIAEEWLMGHYSASIDATRLMWAFFTEHPLPGRGSR